MTHMEKFTVQNGLNYKNCAQQLGFRCGCKPNNETRVERNRLQIGQPMELS